MPASLAVTRTLAVVAPAAGVGRGVKDPVATVGALQLRLSGRLLDVRNPVAKVSPDADARVSDLLAGVAVGDAAIEFAHSLAFDPVRFLTLLALFAVLCM